MHKILLRIFKLKGRNPFLFFYEPYSSYKLGQMSLGAVLFLLAISIIAFGVGFNISKFSPLAVIGLLAAIAVGLVTLVNTNFALVILIFSMLLSPEIGGAGVGAGERGVSLRIEDFLIIAVFFVWLTKITINKELGLVRKTPLNGPIFLYIATNIFCTALGIGAGNVNIKNGFFYMMKYIEFFMIYFLFVNNLNEMRQLKIFLFCFLLTSFIIGTYTYSQMGSSDRPSAPFEGEHTEPNTLAAYLLLCLSVTLGIFLFREFSVTKTILAGLFCFNIYPLLLTLSRSAYLGFIFSYLSITFMSKRAKLFLFTVLAMSILFVPLIAPKKTIDRIRYTFAGKEEIATALDLGIKLDKSATARVNSWLYAFGKLKERPLFGHGVTGIRFIDGQYARSLAELGLIGFFPLLWLIFAVLKNCWQIYHNVYDNFSLGLSLGFLCGFIGLLIVGFGANIFVIVRISEPMWFLAACVMVLPEIEKISLPPTNLEEKLAYQ
ncbi:MAG: O-antigen ligase family protein [Candidatus Omnitrophota bacterium]|nr:O-antigen ligase family protein [Candidatus Omnitrophota bacterium]